MLQAAQDAGESWPFGGLRESQAWLEEVIGQRLEWQARGLDSVLGPLGSHRGFYTGDDWVWLAFQHNCSSELCVGSTAGAICHYQATSLQSKEVGPGLGSLGI